MIDDQVDTGSDKEEEDEWETVRMNKRRRNGAALDRVSVVIWHVPPDTPVPALYSKFCSPDGCLNLDSVAEIQWKKNEEQRFVLLSMFSSLMRDFCFDSIRRFCENRGWRAVKSRSFEFRELGRRMETKMGKTTLVKSVFSPLAAHPPPKGPDQRLKIRFPRIPP